MTATPDRLNDPPAPAVPPLHGLRRLVDGIGIAGGIAVALMALHVVLDVVARNLAGLALSGTTEFVAGWYMVAIVFCTLGSVHARGDHIRVDLIDMIAGPRLDGLLTVFTSLIFLAVAVAMVLWGIDDALNATLRGERVEFTAWALPVWPGRWLVPLGFALTGLVALLDLGRGVGRLIQSHSVPGDGA
ncbi:TRAP transporter small permease (plasmid) [Tistrella mobilis]|uniref:TRAP transporter small permease subunit n=1 Tax=Tistrella mobilis TaxID=171437 RepID=UPI003557AC9E